VEEQLAIFLYTAVTGLSSRHVSERFQCSNETIVRYFKKILIALWSPPFYMSQVQLPMASTPLTAVIDGSPHFRFFHNCIGAVDGTHIHAFICQENHPSMHNRKGFLSQNCLFICDFNFIFYLWAYRMGWINS
ncbi:hypothetical protein SCLCIDRAFT_129664, partial [Scleroderma citrinum Foug A]